MILLFVLVWNASVFAREAGLVGGRRGGYASGTTSRRRPPRRCRPPSRARSPPASAPTDRGGARPQARARRASPACRRAEPARRPARRSARRPSPARTKCTVAPCSADAGGERARDACQVRGRAAAARGGCSGSGRSRASTNSADSSRMKPARQMSSMPATRSASSSCASNASLRREVAAVERAGASTRLARIRKARRIGIVARRRARSPRDIVRPSRRRSARRDCCRARRSGRRSSASRSAIEIEPAGEHDGVGLPRRDPADRRHHFAVALEEGGRISRGIRRDDEHHADAAIEGAEHLRLRDRARRASGTRAAR